MKNDHTKHIERISEIRQETEDAENRGNAEEMSKHFASDIIILGPNMPTISGIDDATDAIRGFLETFDLEIHYSSEETQIMQGWAFDRGTYQQKIGPKNSESLVSETGKYLWVNSLDTELNWKQARIMWNSSDELLANDA